MPVTPNSDDGGDLLDRIQRIADMLRAKGLKVEVSPDIARPHDAVRRVLDAAPTCPVVSNHAGSPSEAKGSTPTSRAQPFQGVRV